jgi:hypothetical protein
MGRGEEEEQARRSGTCMPDVHETLLTIFTICGDGSTSAFAWTRTRLRGPRMRADPCMQEGWACRPMREAPTERAAIAPSSFSLSECFGAGRAEQGARSAKRIVRYGLAEF